MDCAMKNRREREAFTLLEVMLAVTILGLVMASVYATWSAALSGWKRSSTVSAAFQRERVVMDTLTELASSIVYFGSQKGLYDLQGTHDDLVGDTISFVTASDTALPQSESAMAGMRRVTISVQRDQQDNPFLAVVNQPALQPSDAAVTNEIHVLSADVRGFQVWYRDPRDQSWKDKWEDPDSLPLAISFTVAFAGSDSRTPPVIVTRAVDVPPAMFAMQSRGLPVNQQSTTNQIEQRNINLLQPAADTGPGMQ